jgi:hypothetical protein
MSKALLERILVKIGCGEKTARAAFTRLILDAVDCMDGLSVRLSGYDDFREYVRLLFARQDAAVTLYFTADQIRLMERYQREYNIGLNPLLRLALSSSMFQAGRRAIPLRRIAAGLYQTDRRCTVVMTKPVYDRLRQAKKGIGASEGLAVRAAYLFYESGLGEKPPLVNPDFYRADNAKTGWARISFLYGNGIRERVEEEKKIVRATIPVIVSHTLYSFLQEGL